VVRASGHVEKPTCSPPLYLSVAGAVVCGCAAGVLGVNGRERAMDGDVRPERRDRIRDAPGFPDLQTQLEALLDQVWRCEAGWRVEDRIDRAVRVGCL
jgi:hypothetical protein